MASNKTAVDIDVAKALKQIERASKRLRDNAENVLLDQQQPLKERIERLAPRGERADPEGHIADNIFVDVVQRPNGPVLKAGVRGVRHAVFKEFGTKKTRAEPFVRPALAEIPGKIKRRGKG